MSWAMLRTKSQVPRGSPRSQDHECATSCAVLRVVGSGLAAHGPVRDGM